MKKIRSCWVKRPQVPFADSGRKDRFKKSKERFILFGDLMIGKKRLDYNDFDCDIILMIMVAVVIKTMMRMKSTDFGFNQNNDDDDKNDDTDDNHDNINDSIMVMRIMIITK